MSASANASGNLDGNTATLNPNSSITLDMGSTLSAGNNLLITFSTNNLGVPLQVLVSTNAGGPYTNIGKLVSTANIPTQSIQLPINARYVQLQTTGTGYGYLDAVTYPIYTCVSLPSTNCGSGQTRIPYTVGAQSVTALTGSVSNTTNAIGLLNGTVAVMNTNSSFVLNMGSVLTAGNTLNFTYLSLDANAPLQVWISTNAGGPYTNIAQLTGSTTMKTVNLRLPINAQYVQLQTTGTGYSVDAITQTFYSCVDVPVASCPSGQVSTSYQVGVQTVGATTGTVSNTANMIGVVDGNVAALSTNSSLIADLGSTLSAGSTLYFTFSGGNYTNPLQVLAAATAGGPYTTIAQLSSGSLSTALPVTLLSNTRYIQLQTTGAAYNLDAITYPLYTCVPLPGTCVAGQQSVSYPVGAQGVTSTTGTVSTGTNLLGLPDGAVATVSNNSTILLNLGTVVAAGNSLQVTYSSSSSIEPLQIWVATNQGGPYTNIAQLNYSSTTITATVNLPLDAQYVKLQSAGYTTFSLDAVTYSIYTCVNNPATLCSAGQQVASYMTGVVSSTGSANVTSASAVTGTPDGLYAAIGTSGSGTLTLDLGTIVAGGNILNVKYTSSNSMPPLKVLVATTIGGPYTTIGQLTASTTAKTGTIILPFDVRYVQFQATQFSVDAVTRAVYTCVSSTITSGMVYLDSDIDGKLGSTEQGVGGVTVQAYDAAGHLAATTTTSYGNPAFSIPAGYYSFNNLIAGQPYKLEFSNWPSQYTPSAYGLMNGTSVQFVQGVSQNNNLGVYMPSMVCSYRPNARMVTAKGYYGTYAPTAVDSYSYPYSGITNDISYLQIGVPLGMASQRPNNWVYMAPLWTNMPTVFPQAPDGPSAIYIASYNNPNGTQSYQGVKLLVKLSDLGINVGNLSTTVGGNPFGVQGLGGLAFSQSGDTLYAVNMSSGKLVQVDVSNADYTNPPATSPTAASELTPPPSLVNCSGGVYRPTALAQYGGKIYMGGVCDASTSQNNADLQGVVMAYDPSTQTWSKALNYPINFTAGSIATRGLTQVGWATSGSFQPVLLDLAFSDNGEMVIGTTNRLLYGAATSSNQYGYILGAWPNGDGTYTLENGGKLGPYTSGVTYYLTGTDGPGNKFFFQQSTFPYHIYTYEGGLYIKSGTNEVAGGFTDLVNGYTYGVGYLNLSTGVYQNNLQLGSGVKIARTLGFDQVCDAIPPIEIGNRVWKDTNGNGIQDAGEPALAGVTVELRFGNGSLVATAVTDTNGNYIFSNQSGITNTISQQYGLPLTQLTAYKLVISSLGTNSAVAGLALTDVPPAPGETAGSSNSGATIDNNDSFLVSGLPTINLKTGADGLLNHTYDFGLGVAPCSLSLTATPGTCDPATNQYTLTGTISLTAAPASSLTLTDGLVSTLVAVTAGQTTATYSLSGLSAGTGLHTVTILSSATTCATASVTYTAPLSCSVAPALALSVTPGICSTATNQYSVAGTISLTAAVPGTLTITDGTVTTTVSVTGGQSTTSFSLTGLASGTGTHTVTVSGIGYAPVSTTYTAPTSCTVAVALTVTPGTCNTATNQYSISGTLSLTNAVTGTATITDGSSTTTVAVSAGATSVPYTLAGLNSGTGSHTVTVSYVGETASTTYTAPTSCTIAVALTVTPGSCNTATNQYSISGSLSLTNAVAGTATITDGTATTTVLVTAGATSLPYSLTGLTSGTGSHTVTVSYVGKTASATYSAPASCTIAVALTVTPGSCNTATNQYSISGTLSLTNAVAGTATITDGSSTTTVAIAAGATSVPYTLAGLNSDGLLHTVTVSYVGETASTTYTAPSSCTVSVALTVTPGTCNTATNQYSISGTLSLTNAVAGTATITDGSSTTTISVSAGAISVPYTLAGLNSGTGSHTVTVSYVGKTTSQTYSAPASCTVAIDLTVTPGVCQSATNQYSISGTLSLTNAVAGTATISDGTSTTTVATSAGATSVPYLLGGLNSGTGSHTVTVSYVGKTVSTTYTAPSSCTVAVALTVTPGTCNTATNQYSISGTLSLTNAVAGVATITDGVNATTVSVGAGVPSVAYSLTGLVSDGSLHTVSVSYADQTARTTYSAPASCTVAPCGLAMVVTPGLCESATNSYVLSGTIIATHVPTSGTLTISSGAFAPRSLTLPVGNASGTFSYSGLVSNGQTYTLTASYSDGSCTPVSQTYTAPTSCSVAPVCSISATATAGICSTATNTYSATVTVSMANASAGTVTINMPGATPISQTIAANTGTFTAIFANLVSDGLSHIAAISLPGCGTTTATFTAPASCSLAPVCSISAVATAGVCQTATNAYSSTVVVTINNPTGGTLSVTDGGQTLTFSTTANAQNTFTAEFANQVSDGSSHTVVASLPGCSTTTATYTAPASCSIAPVCSLSAVATAGLCASATNTYSATAVVTVKNPIAGLLTITHGAQSATFVTTAGSSATFTAEFPGLLSDGANHTVVVSLPGCSTTTTTYTAPASCSVTPVCNLSVTASGHDCDPITNRYVLSGTITLTNSPASQTLTLTDGSYVRSLTATAGNSTIAFSYTTLQSDGLTHTVTVTSSAATCGVASTTYTAPASCSVAPVCSLSAVVTTGLCTTATNTFSNTVLVTMNNPTTGTLTITDGAASLTFAVSATLGTVTTTAVFNGLESNGASRIVTVGLPGCTTTTVSYTAPASCSLTPACSISAVVTAGLCASATNTFSTTAVVTLRNVSSPGILTLTDGPQSITFAATASTSASFTAVFTGLTSNGSAHTLTASLPGCSSTTTAYTAPGSCTQPAATHLSLNKWVSRSKANVGDVLTYTIVLTNSGTTTATNVVVRDSSTSGLHYVANSASAPSGTTFTQGTPVSSWKVATISAGQSLSLTFQAVADSSGILYNVATIPGDTATVCTSVPFVVCAGEKYLFRLTALPGRSSYKWYKDNEELIGQTTNVLDVTAPGTYSLVVDNVTGKCPDFSCCPFIVEEQALPTYQAKAVAATCQGNTPQANGQLVLSNFQTGNTYQYSAGSSFNAAAAVSGPAQVIPTTGVIASQLANPTVATAYTVRVYNRSGCYTDVTVMLLPTVCGCPASVCLPIVIRQTRGPRRNLGQ